MKSKLRHGVFVTILCGSLVPHFDTLTIHYGGIITTVFDIWGLKIVSGGHFEFMEITLFPGARFCLILNIMFRGAN